MGFNALGFTQGLYRGVDLYNELARQEHAERRLQLAEQEARGAQALRELQRQKLLQELGDLSQLPGDITAIMRAAQSGLVPTIGGMAASPMDVSDLAGQNLLELKRVQKAQTLPQLAAQVDAASLSRVLRRAPGVVDRLGLKGVAQSQDEELRSAGFAKLSEAIRTRPKDASPDQMTEWLASIVPILAQHKIADPGKMTELLLTAATTNREKGGHFVAQIMDTADSLLARGVDQRTAYSRGLAAAFKKYPEMATEKMLGVVDKLFGKALDPETRANLTESQYAVQIQQKPPAQRTPEERAFLQRWEERHGEKSLARIAAEARARREGEALALSPEERALVLRAKRAEAQWREAMANVRSGRGPRTLRDITADIRQFEGILRGLPGPYGLSEEEKADLAERRSELNDILRELYRERAEARPGGGLAPPPQRVEDSGDVGANRARPTELARAQAELGALEESPARERARAAERDQVNGIIKRLFPGKTWFTLTDAEKQRVVDARNRSEMPPAEDFPGRTIRDTVTGKRYRSDGHRWSEIR